MGGLRTLVVGYEREVGALPSSSAADAYCWSLESERTIESGGQVVGSVGIFDDEFDVRLGSGEVAGEMVG